MPANKYVGLDVHSSSYCYTVAVVGRGSRLPQSKVLETRAKVLVYFRKTVPGLRTVREVGRAPRMVRQCVG